MRQVLSLLLATLLICGCEKRRENASTIVEDDSEFMCALIVDMSGSFSGEMAENGRAYAFANSILDKYFKDRIGTNDKLLIGQLSGRNEFLLWQGTPLQLRQDFASAQSFADFLRSKANPNGSPVHDAIAQTIEYVLDEPGVSSGKAKAAIFVLSDMLDTSAPDSKEKALQQFANFGKNGGVVGLYYVDQHLVTDWRSELRKAGVKEFCVESGIVSRPRLPTFE